MIGVWCTEGPIYVDKDGSYYGITINNSIIKRYLEYMDKIYILTRIRKIRPEIKNATKIENANIEIIELPNCSTLKGIFINPNKVKKIVSKYIEKSDFMIVGLPSILGNIAIDVCKKQNKQYIVELLACPWDALWNHGKITGKIMAPIQYFITKSKIKNSRNVIYVSNEFLQRRYPNYNNSLNCSDVILEELDENILQKRIDKIKRDTNIYKLGLIGSLDLKYKGHNTAIKAVSLLKDTYNIELHFLGKGSKEYFESYAEKNKVKENVKFDGTLPAGKQVYNWIDEIDIFLIPSLQEGMPRALIEAMSRACPAIGVKTGGIPELIDKAFVCKRKAYQQIAERIELLLINKELMETEAKKNFEKSKEFQKEILYRKRKQYYEKIIKEI